MLDKASEPLTDGSGDRSEIMCIGEVLWDSLPLGLFLGGAPVNVAHNLHQLGESVAVASRVGNDHLGKEAVRRLQARGIAVDLIQEDSHLDTGFVEVFLDGDGDPSYNIVDPVAWDAIELTQSLVDRASAARAVVFGSLAQRNPITRRTIRSLCEGKSLKIFDVNLRPPYDGRETVEYSLHVADLTKLNEDELIRIGDWFGLPSAMDKTMVALAEKFDCETVCVTRGGNGAVLWHLGRMYDHSGFRIDVEDAVGAGDAFLAGLIAGLFKKSPPDDVLEMANAVGAFVASRMGATPDYDFEEIETIRRGVKRET